MANLVICLSTEYSIPKRFRLLKGAMFGNDIQPWFSEEFGYIDLQVPALADMILGTIALVALPVSTANYR